MADNLFQYSDNLVGNWYGAPETNWKSGEQVRKKPALPAPGCKPAPPPPEQLLLDRLNAAINQDQPSVTDNAPKYYLDELGKEIRQWRLQRGYTRAVLAGKLKMKVDRLTCLENGIAQTGDISARQLRTLERLSSGGKTDPLAVAIEDYLASLEP